MTGCPFSSSLSNKGVPLHTNNADSCFYLRDTVKSQIKALGLYSGGGLYIWNDIWVSTQGSLYLGGLYSGFYGIFVCGGILILLY